MATMDSPSTYPESPMDQEDVVYPCKGCGEILEEGKAFELAGNRWHIDCFRCNTCGTLLDSDANLLLLGDGSLICNNCTYSCNACGNKIEDLAILTGDQAFCSGCFRCRNCKRKIENLRYARTSQGIFCMSCHESLMARRRKKARTPKQTAQNTSAGADKALPSLPPGVAPSSAFTPEEETPPEPYSEGQTPQAHTLPRDRQVTSRNGSTLNSYLRDASPVSDDARRDGPTLPASTYNESRPSNVSSSVDDDDSERGYLPMAFDPTPIHAPPPQQPPIPRKQVVRTQEPSPPSQKENQPPRDYFSTNGRLSAKPSSREAPQADTRQETAGNASSRSVSTEREPDRDRSVSQPKPSPHILYQEKGRSRKRETSGNNTLANGSTMASPVVPEPREKPGKLQPYPLATDAQSLNQPQSQQESFRLQDVPDNKRVNSRKNSRAGQNSPMLISPVDKTNRDDRPGQPISPISVASRNSGVNPFDDPKRKEAPISGATPVQPIPPKHADRGLPLRGDSLAATAVKSKQSTPDPPTPSTTSPRAQSTHARNKSTSSVPSSSADAQSTLSRDNSHSRPEHPPPAPPRASFDAVPPRAPARPTAPSKSVANDDFIAPRHAPPPPPTAQRHRHNESISTMQSEDRPSLDGPRSPLLHSVGLPKYSLDGGFSMDDEMGRILRGEQSQLDGRAGASSPSVLRRVSNAVKHGRSFSDRAVTQGGRSPRNGSVDIGTPTITSPNPNITSPTGVEGVESLRASLRRAQNHIAELETDKLALQEKLDGATDIKAVNTELREKRSTMAFLDTQREMVVRELEVMTEHLAKAKDSTQPLDLTSLKTSILKDFGDSLQRLKDTMGTQIEDLIHKRNELTDEIGNLIQMKDKGFQEYESLSSKNAQLAQHNNELIRSIQAMYQDYRGPNGTVQSTNGLGISGAYKADPASSEVRNLNPVMTDSSMPNLLQDQEGESATVLTAPQVVNIRKGGQAKKFNWRRGGEKITGKVTKGIMGAFVGNDPKATGAGQYSIGMPYNATQALAGSEQGSTASKSTLVDDGKGYGFFNQKNGGLKGGLGPKNNSSSNVAMDGSVLFGSELSARCEHEGRVLPLIVTTCVQEVERRGLTVEGIYRKSGGAGQVKTVQSGFEHNEPKPLIDITDADLDIHAVTSALKQYFRKLPTPLIVYDVYDSLLEAGQIVDKQKQSVALKHVVESLPEAHHDTLGYLIGHLAKVMSHESSNLMTPLNLAVVFAPTIMRPLSIEREMSDMQIQRIAVQALLEHHKAVFGED